MYRKLPLIRIAAVAVAAFASIFTSSVWSALENPTSTTVLQSVPTPGESAGLALQVPKFPAAKPWTSLEIDNDPKDFQFLIVTDRTGGLRPGIFDKAVQKINLLRPEFVMSVGDLIMGYTNDEKQLLKEWEEFDGLVQRLKMPFFYVPGNHDVANPIQTEMWRKRYGPLYYHFVYGNVLFLCLNSEDPKPGLSLEQIEYFRKALAENTQVRHTLVFLHRPLWLTGETGAGKLGGPYADGNWSEFEPLLAERPVTVFAGHVHQYTKFVRNKKKYFTLGTTGGGSAMRGAQGFGEFDHVTWVTMTDDGPIMANLDIDGVWDENVRTEEVTSMVQPFLRNGIRAETVVTDPLPFTSATVAIRLQNNADVPAVVELTTPPGLIRWTPEMSTTTLPPNSVEFTSFTLAGDQAGLESQIAEMRLQWKTTFKLDDKPAVTIEDDLTINIDARRSVQRTTASMQIDGQLTDWETPLSMSQNFFDVKTKRRAYLGAKDGSFKMAARYDNSNVYFAFDVTDNALEANAPAANPRQGDCFELRLDLSEGDGTTDVLLLAVPAQGDAAGAVKIVRGVEGMQTAVAKSTDGYVLEVGIPVASLNKKENWQRIRANMILHDHDPAEPKATLTWKPGWDTPENYEGSGEFVKR